MSLDINKIITFTNIPWLHFIITVLTFYFPKSHWIFTHFFQIIICKWFFIWIFYLSYAWRLLSMMLYNAPLRSVFGYWHQCLIILLTNFRWNNLSIWQSNLKFNISGWKNWVHLMVPFRNRYISFANFLSLPPALP